MRNLVTKLCLGLAVTAVAALGADPLLGTWKLNSAKSAGSTTNPIKSRTDVYEAAPNDAIRITRIEERTDGSRYNYTYTLKFDGKEYPVKGGTFDTVSARRADANTTTYEIKKAGSKLHQTGKFVLSRDGKTRTQTVTGTDADGKPVDLTLVYEKQ